MVYFTESQSPFSSFSYFKKLKQNSCNTEIYSTLTLLGAVRRSSL